MALPLIMSCEHSLVSHTSSCHQPILMPGPSSGTKDRWRPTTNYLLLKVSGQIPGICATEEGRQEPGRRAVLYQGGWSSEQAVDLAGE